MAGPADKSSSGLEPNLAAALSYLLGFITGVLFLVLEKDNAFVRFHAMQSTITFVGVLVIQLLLVSTPFVGWFLYVPFILGVTVLWVFLMFKAWKGETYRLPYVGDWAAQQLK
jgi:uncharacterized membrane protein